MFRPFAVDKYHHQKLNHVAACTIGLNTRAGEDFNAYARARNQAKWGCRNAVKEHERTIAQQAKQNPKAFYSHVNHKLMTKSSIPDLGKPAGGETSGDLDKAEVLNNILMIWKICQVLMREK